MLMLPMELDERRRAIVQRCGRDECVVDECAAAALCVDIAADDKFIGFDGGQPPYLEESLHAGL